MPHCCFVGDRFFPKFPGANTVDDGLWVAVVSFALQFWDFFSDINLTVEMWGRSDIGEVVILICAIGSTMFILIPYVANLVYATRIKNIIRGNEAAKSWFMARSRVFTFLVVLTGGCYPALSLVSSNVFGLKILSSGLTQYELKKLTRIKVFTTVILENVPQLVLQALYAYAIGTISEPLALAFFASLGSVAASTMGYLIDKDGRDLKVVEYYISFEKTGKISAASPTADGGVTRGTTARRLVYDGDDEDEAERRMQTNTMIQTAEGDDALEDKAHGDLLSPEQKQKVVQNKGKTQALGEAIASVYEVPPKNVEIGHTMLTTKGARTHIVHYISQNDIDIMQKTMVEAQANIHVTPEYIVRELFNFKAKEVTQAFKSHFFSGEAGLGRGFEAVYNDYHGTSNLEMALSKKNMQVPAQSPDSDLTDSFGNLGPVHGRMDTLSMGGMRGLAGSIVQKHTMTQSMLGRPSSLGALYGDALSSGSLGVPYGGQVEIESLKAVKSESVELQESEVRNAKREVMEESVERKEYVAAKEGSEDGDHLNDSLVGDIVDGFMDMEDEDSDTRGQSTRI